MVIMGGKPKKPWYLFSFLDLEIFDTPEVRTSGATNGSGEASTSQPRESITNDTLEKQVDSFRRLCIDTPLIHTSSATEEDKDGRVSQPRQSSTNNSSKKPLSALNPPYSATLQSHTNEATHEDKQETTVQPSPPAVQDTSEKSFRFLDLPAELRNNIYELLQPAQCKALKSVLFKPQVFEDNIPQSFSLDITAWSCRKLTTTEKRAKRCDNAKCGDDVKDFLNLTLVNRQIRTEVKSILYACCDDRKRTKDMLHGRCGEEKTYNFETMEYFKGRNYVPKGSFLPSKEQRSRKKYDADSPLFKLDREEKWAVLYSLGSYGVPFAVLRTKAWFNGIESFRYELLVPFWRDDAISWTKFSDVVPLNVLYAKGFENDRGNPLPLVRMVARHLVSKGKDLQFPYKNPDCGDYPLFGNIPTK